MLKARRQAADQVATRLFAAETAISEAVLSVADLVQVIQTARREANLSAVIGNDAAFRAIACLSALGTANQELVQAHHDLADTQRQIGLGAVATGAGGGAKPNESQLTGPAIAAVAA